MAVRTAGLIAGALVLASCVTEDGNRALPRIFEPAPETAVEALNRYYADIPASELPRASEGVPLPESDAVLSRILVASCNDEEQESPTLARLGEEEADLFLMIGDNVYGDRDGRAYANNQPELSELRESFSDLAARPEFQAVREKFPMMVAWDDHDYGANDAGRGFPFKELAERIHENFWGLADQDVGQWPGTYYARSFGPEGQRVQVIMLDTRFFRSPLTPTDEYGAEGKERYIPAPEGSEQDMLGAEQWTWLENQLQKPADIRLVVSSIQVMPTAHGWEAWATMPAERERLFDLVSSTGANGVVFLTGDRHTGFIYEERGVLPYAANELTASSLNLSFADKSDERDPRQIGAAFPPENYGAVEIDWEARMLSLVLKDGKGQTARRNNIAFSDIGVD
ncbi:alkaline phosphatase D family protein [Henriciella sp.]|uniref:alkaline phosphatase D family protein n=1 Tax=Henriciella sp. TaxID=1968823 RepID=UPI00261846F7|nr:alkaline phosphatase D family protein [Henriciella sp.]